MDFYTVFDNIKYCDLCVKLNYDPLLENEIQQIYYFFVSAVSSVELLNLNFFPPFVIDSREIACPILAGQDYHLIAKPCRTMGGKTGRKEG